MPVTIITGMSTPFMTHAREWNRDTIPYGHMLQEYYVRRLREVCARRAAERRNIRTPRQIFAHRETIRQKLRRCFGPLPAHTPLNARTTGVLQTPDCRIEKILYQSRPGLWITGNLYLPRRAAPPFPVVLIPCGHANNGKAYENYQRLARGFARKGFMALLYDPIGQGERHQYSPNQSSTCPQGCVSEHDMLGKQMSLTGEFFGAWRLWDGIRSLDYLLSRSEADRRHIGVVGNSGGGTLTSYLNAFDDRITMAAPSCYVTTFLTNVENENYADSEQNPPGIWQASLDIADFFIAQIPRPVILLGQQEDYFDIRGLRQTYAELRRLYGILGMADRIRLHISPNYHGIDRPQREAAYAFFQEICGRRVQSREPRLKIAKESQLLVTPKGNVHTLRQARRVYQLTGDCARRMHRPARRMSAGVLQARLRRLLQLPARRPLPHQRRLWGVENHPGGVWRYSKFAFETEPGIQAMLHYFNLKRYVIQFPAGKTATILLPHLSSLDDYAHADLPCARANLFALDVRGTGESRPLSCGRKDARHFARNECFYASLGQMLGESLLSRRVYDALAVLDIFQA